MLSTDWAWRIRHRHEAIIVETLPLRDRLELYAAVAVTTPRQLVAYFHHQFLRWAPLPDDRWENILCDKRGVVVRCLPDGVLLEVASARFVDEFGRDWELNRPAATVPAYEIVRHEDYGWRRAR